jgi:hypothetical protein
MSELISTEPVEKIELFMHIENGKATFKFAGHRIHFVSEAGIALPQPRIEQLPPAHSFRLITQFLGEALAHHVEAEQLRQQLTN